MSPSIFVLVCLIDGILYTEREEFEDDMERVVRTVLQTCAMQRVGVFRYL